ncbi:MAG: helix-turn-helix domain-containing protein [Myxococcota bacterium]|nr:helix-turn-helix domain-containing protein [Myxococcota bacterium]
MPRTPSERSRPPRSRRSQARGRATRERLLRAAEELFRRHGYAGTGVGDIAARAGASVGTLYHHFPDKRAMLLALIDDWGDRATARRRSDLDMERFLGDDPRAAIRRWLRTNYERERKRPSLYLVVLGLANQDDEVRRRYQRIEQSSIARLGDFFRFGQRRGLMREDLDAEATAFLIHHAIDMAATQLLVREERAGEADADRVLESLVDMFCRTLLRAQNTEE